MRPSRSRLQKRDYGVNNLAIPVWFREKGASFCETRPDSAGYRLTAGVEHRNPLRELADLQSAFELVAQGYVGEDQVERLIGLDDRFGLRKGRGGACVMSCLGKDRLSVHEDHGLVFYYQDVCH
jgi:hypothetical protein